MSGYNPPPRYDMRSKHDWSWFTFDRHPILVSLAIVGSIAFGGFCLLLWIFGGYG